MLRCVKVVVAARPPFSKTGCFEDGCDEFLGFLFVAVGGFQTVTVCAEEGVASVARGFGIGDDDVNAVFGKVVPIADLFGVVFSDKENHSAGVGRSVVGEGLLPAFSTSPFFRAGRCRRIGSWLRHRLEGRWLRIMPVCWSRRGTVGC